MRVEVAAERLDVGVAGGRRRGGRLGGNEIDWRDVRSREVRADHSNAARFEAGTKMDLHDCVAELVENLQAAARAVLARELDREGLAPVRQEQPQIDVAVQDQSGTSPSVMLP